MGLPLLRLSSVTLLSLVVFDACGDAFVSSQKLGEPPIIAIAAPSDGASVSLAALVVRGTVSDDTDGVSVSVALDATYSVDASGTPDFSAIIPAAELSVGDHTITATATDAGGLTASATVRVTVVEAAGDTTVPTVAFTAPASGAALARGVISISGTAADDTGLAAVELSIDGADAVAVTGLASWSYNWDATSASFANHSLVVTARDAAGNEAQASRSVTVVDTTGDTPASVAAACAAEPMIGTVYYYCDCGTGAQSGCVPGDDANAGTDPAFPRRTIENAAAFLRSQAAANDTVALCQGGAFDATTGWLNIGSGRCATGQTCNDLREYTPTTFSGTPKPIINNASGTVYLFYIAGDLGGVRVLNLKLNGDNGAHGNRNRAFYFYEGAHDVTICNVDMDAFDIAVTNESNNGVTNNIKLTGSSITNSRSMGFLGGGDNMDLSYCQWDANGGSNVLDHTIYLGTSVPVSNIRILGNYIHGQQGSTCLGSVITAHGQFDHLFVGGNTVEIDASANTNGGCWGIDINSGGYDIPIYFRNTSISNNVFSNTGNQAISISSCPECFIENNLIIQDWSGAAIGIAIAWEAARTNPADDVNTANVVRNNTIYYGPHFSNIWGGATGIRVGTEGSGHVVANNTVSYSSTTPGTGFNCYAYPLALSSYAFINNNHCHSAASSYSWVAGRGSLAEWQTYSSAFGFGTESRTGDPLFARVGIDFTPGDGSPLIGKGDAANGSTHDITAKARNNPPDIGAYEHL